MNTNTVVFKKIDRAEFSPCFLKAASLRTLLAGLILFVFIMGTRSGYAAAELGAWVPIFKGVEHAVGTNMPDGSSYSVLQVVHIVRVDLTDPDVRLFSSPPLADYVEDQSETAGYRVSTFLLTNQLQVAINANVFSPGDTYLAEGTAMNISGLSICQGVVVSPQSSSSDAASLLFTSNNTPILNFNNWPATNTAGIYTAVSGMYSILVNGVNVGRNYLGDSDSIHGYQPRTAFGISADRRYLFLMTLDGRQAGYSNGSLDFQTADWLLLAGASDGINMDGGGSTTLAMQTSTGGALVLNHSSTMAERDRERTVGSHFGVYAKPVPGFINDIQVELSDTSAVVSWATTNAATAQVQYGLTTDLGSASDVQSNLATNHSVILAGLKPNTGYYFEVIAGTDSQQYSSPVMYFKTAYYVTTNLIFDITNSWTYSIANLDGINWTAVAYDDSSWTGSGPGLLYVDKKNQGVISPANTEMLANGNYPYPTYYFRTHFQLTNAATAVSLVLSNYIDDGAVFYLNGAEIYRLRMAEAPAVIQNSALAVTYPCSGNATCSDVFEVTGDAVTNLVSGDNVMAVEVHNYSTGSQDITFGTALYCLQSIPTNTTKVELKLAYASGQITLSWDSTGYTLQQADSLTGTWSDVAGVSSNTYTTTPADGGAKFYRLRR